MTAICPAGGPSQAKLGFGLAVAVTPVALGVRFLNSANWISTFLAGYMAGVSYELGSFCTNDPPAVPTLDAADFVALTAYLQPVARLQAQQKIQQWLAAHLWYDFCECTGGGTPAAPSPQAEPADLPTVDPPSVFPTPIAQPCYTASLFHSIVAGGGDQDDVLPSILGWDASIVRFTATATPHTAAQGSSIILYAVSPTGTNTQITFANISLADPGPIVKDALIPAGTDHLYAYFHSAGNAGVTYDFTATVEVYCGGDAPDKADSPCCPPDPQITAQLEQVLQLVTLIQRQIAPFGYVSGPVHAGLTGHGSFAVQGIIGIRIVLTTSNIAGGIVDGSPQELFEQGFATLGTADGYEHSIRIDHQEQLVLPIAAGAFTKVGYTLEPNVVATITELMRES